MACRIEVGSKVPDARAFVRKGKFESRGFAGKIGSVEIADVYTLDISLSKEEAEKVSSMLINPVTQFARIGAPIFPEKFSFAIEIGYLPGVKDNVAATVREEIEDLLKKKIPASEDVYTSQVTFVSGGISNEDSAVLGELLANPLIQRIHIRGFEEFKRSGGMGVVVPKVRLKEEQKADVIDILSADDEALKVIGKQGISNKDGSKRGPLALDLAYMKAIRDYFRKKGCNPTDVELESIAQTWSEHCKHTIFADSIDEIEDGLYHHYIKASTNEIRKRKGKGDFCVSVFLDNSGAIIFDKNYLVTDKAETHNSPSALDPFGGAITGIVGVNRDAIGFGLGAKPIINRYGFCFADPSDKKPLFKGEKFSQKMLSARAIMDGVIEGVRVGGNCSGIPTPQGFLVFDERYKGKPLVFVGTLGLIPRKSAGRDSFEKQALPGDLIVMVGGRVGKDGIHGATFSSEALDSGSPATAVQIGDPITQKKLSDALVKEARDLALYTSITDNGAGGLSCSVAEMAKECGGCAVELEKVPLKYPGLSPWEIWISESQERMTLSVPKGKWKAFKDLMDSRGVEATVIGVFNDSGKCAVSFNGKTVMDVEMDFLHDGLPPRPIKTTYARPSHPEPSFAEPASLNDSLLKLLSRLNISSFEFISNQFDHEVQGTSVIKPLQGRGRVGGDASVVRPVLSSPKGVVVAYGINPGYSDVDTYKMAACAIDTAIRNAVACGADLNKVALLDNFCWCSSTEPERLGQLKEAVKACYDYSIAFQTPFISGKDSMFNDFKGFDDAGKAVKISIPPTLLVSSVSVMEDSAKSVSIDAKFEGDLVYVLNDTLEELGASEYFAMNNAIGNKVPSVSAEKNKKLYNAFSKAIEAGLVSSAVSVHRGGLGVAFSKSAMAGLLGMKIDLGKLPGKVSRSDYALFSETQGRIVATVNPQNKKKFEGLMKGNLFAEVGAVGGSSLAILGSNGKEIVNAGVAEMLGAYKKTFGGF